MDGVRGVRGLPAHFVAPATRLLDDLLDVDGLDRHGGPKRKIYAAAVQRYREARGALSCEQMGTVLNHIQHGKGGAAAQSLSISLAVMYVTSMLAGDLPVEELWGVLQ